MMRSSRDKIEGMYTVVGREEEGPLCDPGSELLLGGSTGRERESNARKIKGMEKKSSRKRRDDRIQRNY